MLREICFGAESLVLWLSSVFVVAHAQWQDNGTPVSTAMNSQNYHALVPDGFGGAIVAWIDSRNGFVQEDIYAQRIDSLGVALWTTEGVPVCTAPGQQEVYVSLVPDGSGGAFVFWRDLQDEEIGIFGQRLNAYGVTQWPTNGIPVLSTGSIPQGSIGAVSDGAGGSIIATTVHPGNVIAQRVLAVGVPDGVIKE